MRNETLEALKECARILDLFLNSGSAAPSVDDVDRALTRANAVIRAAEGLDPEATIPEQDICGCHQPIRYCLFPKCGGRKQ